ncbi:FAD-dependent oxidoreductase [Pseudoflavonifractor sp. An44]|uniref:FAD-dependent oxidoreductase n=1 Tax=Pseudoflavonifractor sp. An44 TaxID=1965635 RepID=UPI000B39E0B5|nr:FAD-dependent oxidoreductase [Pseudoflavonifractor sp. An44]OUN97040.1 FAD-dependent oxidoreductase [Pseudoflavonifractor sp. An44]
MKSLWEQTAELNHFDCLDGDIKTDVLIIGGGMAGLLCAYQLHQAGVPYVLAEADTICSGVTKNTTAKLTIQHGLIYHKLLGRFGNERTKGYLSAQEEALKRYRTLCRKIDCDYEEADSYVYARDNLRNTERELDALHRLGFPGEFASQLPLPFAVAGGVKFPRQAQFHPLKFAAAISQGLHIYEHTMVKELIGRTAITNHGRIHAKHIVVTTHFPFLSRHGSYFIKLYQHRSYVLALEHAPNLNGMYVDQTQTGLSFRNYGSMLLVGGGGHRTGKPGGNWRELRQFVKEYYPESTEKYHWATQDCMSLDNLPYIGPYWSNTSDVYVATGFNKWGMTNSMVAATLLCDLVQGKQNPYAEVFSPARSIFRPQLAVNALESTVTLLTPSTRRCSHLGCALKWNAAEHTWDCPCHGSRFTRDGTLIDNPATKDLKP